MNVVNPNDTSHTINIVPRHYIFSSLNVILFNESTQISTTVADTYNISNGYLEVSFDFTFSESDRFQIKITDNLDGVVYRGKIFATAQNTQNYKATNDNYYYE